MEIDTPTVSGSVSLRLDTVADQTSNNSNAYQSCYLRLENGRLCWYEDMHMNLCIGVAYLLGKCSISADGPKDDRWKIVTFPVITKSGPANINLRLKHAKLWQLAVDTYITRCPQTISSLPSYAFDLDDARYSSLNISTIAMLNINGSTYEVPLSVHDDINIKIDLLFPTNNTNPATRREITLALLQEQNAMVTEIIRRYYHLERADQQVQAELWRAQQQLLAAEEHDQRMTLHYNQIEGLIPLIDSLKVSYEMQHDTDDEDFTMSLKQPIAAANKENKTNPLYTQSKHHTISYKTRYEQTLSELQQTKMTLQTTQLDLQQALQGDSQIHKIQALRDENARLRELTASMRSEILELNEQLADIQMSALDRLEQLQVEQAQQQSQHQQPDLAALMRQGQAQIEESEEFNQQFQQSQEDSMLDEELDLDSDELLVVSDLDHDNWTNKYRSFLLQNISSSSLNNKNNDLLLEILQCLGWPACEQRCLFTIFTHYCATTSSPNQHLNGPQIGQLQQQGLSLTRFMRFARDFRCVQTTHKGSMETWLTLADVNGIFTVAASDPNAGQSIVPASKKSFKIGSTNVSASETIDFYRYYSASAHEAKTANKQFIASVLLSFEQFTFAVTLIAEKIFGKVLQHATNNDPYSLSGRERMQARRAMLELCWVRILAPAALAQDLIPWSQFSLRTALVYLPMYKMTVIVNRHVAVIVDVFRNYCTFRNGSTLPKYSSLNSTLNSSPSVALALKGLDYLQSDSIRSRRVSFSAINKLATEHGLVPYLIGEHQLYGLYTELLATISVQQKGVGVDFPIVELPDQVVNSLVIADQRLTGSLLQSKGTNWMSPSSASSPNKQKGGAAGVGDTVGEGLELQGFTILLVAMAMQAFPHVQPAKRMDNLLGIIKQNRSSAGLK